MTETARDRAFLIRQALGSLRKPLPQERFAELLTEAGARLGIAARYYGSTVSDIESGKRSLTLDDIRVIAAVDPSARGEAWLAFGAEAVPTPAEEPVAEPAPHPRREVARATKRRRGP